LDFDYSFSGIDSPTTYLVYHRAPAMELVTGIERIVVFGAFVGSETECQECVNEPMIDCYEVDFKRVTNETVRFGASFQHCDYCKIANDWHLVVNLLNEW